jgi:hypothetical protein
MTGIGKLKSITDCLKGVAMRQFEITTLRYSMILVYGGSKPKVVN